MDNIQKIVLATFLLFTLSTVFDMGTTFYWFAADYNYAMEYEQNQLVKDMVTEYGIFGVFLVPIFNWITYIEICLVGSFIVAVFLFNVFKEKYTYIEKVVMLFCLSFLLISTWHLGAGVMNIIEILK